MIIRYKHFVNAVSTTFITLTFELSFSHMKKLLSSVILSGLLLAACNNNDRTSAGGNDATSNVAAPSIASYQILNTFPHDTLAFTEGLQFVDGKLYESVGNYGASDVRITDVTTGKVEQKQPLEEKYFGEGMTVLNGKIYQLTYKEKTGFVYDAKTLKLEKTFSFTQGEGWGLTNDGKNLIMSTGSSTLYFLDPNTLRETNRLDVTNQYGPLGNINELEYINGYIYANVWMEDSIVKIDPSTGKVVKIFDLKGIRQTGGIPASDPLTEKGPDVLNGIAYDSATNKIYITGKNWPKLFEVKLDN